MCAVSMIGDHYRDKWTIPAYTNIPIGPFPGTLPVVPASQQDVDALRKEVQEMKELLKRAKKYDEDNGEPNCEMDDKVAVLKRVAALVGVDLSDIFPK